MINAFVNKWKELLKDRRYRWSLAAGAALLLIAFYINYRAAMYTDQIPVLSVDDLILGWMRDHGIPVYDLSFIYVFGIYATAFIVIFYPILFKPEMLPFSAKTVAAFIIIRAFFISLTHLGAPRDFFRLPGLEDQPGVFRFFFTNDLFFSGHAGFPFLAALLFWQNKALRIFMILMSVTQAMTVLLMRVHYSIDVFSAYFITYSIYAASDKVFNKLNLAFRRIVHSIKAKIVAEEKSRVP